MTDKISSIFYTTKPLTKNSQIPEIPPGFSYWALDYSSYQDVFYSRRIKDFFGGFTVVLEHKDLKLCRNIAKNLKFLIRLHAKDTLYIRRPYCEYESQYEYYAYEQELWVKDREDFFVIQRLIEEELKKYAG